MPDYNKIVAKRKIESSKDIFDIFWEEISPEWTWEYAELFPKHGEITKQNFQGFSFTIDHIWDHFAEADTNHELPETRVISFFGISNAKVVEDNRKMMRKFWGKASKSFAHFGGHYDKGHFMAHGFGGPIDVNLFPHRRDINRGWSAEGKRYRDMEKYVAANPGTMVFSRPIYNDLSVCPYQLEYGYFDKEFNPVIEVFPNRYS